MFKRYFITFILFLTMPLISGCSTNPATGEKQFTAFMSAQDEVRVGAQEHAKILSQYGLYEDKKIQGYVDRVGDSVVRYTERPDVEYKFFVLDSPIVNAFALPGGYIYVTRGLLALANSEAEMASVLGHEAGHITGRHSAERYSHGVATSLGAAILSAAIGSDVASQALGLGGNLYLSSYSRGQERQADSLGIRYLSKSGYDAHGMAGFLNNLLAEKELQAKIDGKKNPYSYFSTHPPTQERVNNSVAQAQALNQAQGLRNQEKYLQVIDGMIYGDSAKHGFVRGNWFYHTQIGFKFSVPEGYKISNQPTQVVAKSPSSDAVIVFDMARNDGRHDAQSYLRHIWMADGNGSIDVHDIESIKVNGMPAATGYVDGSINGKKAQIRLIAITFNDTQFARFQIAVPSNVSQKDLDAIKSSSYSFDRLTDAERNKIQPLRIQVVTARAGDSVSSLSKRMVQDDYREERFRVLNGLSESDRVVAGQKYKVVVQ